MFLDVKATLDARPALLELVGRVAKRLAIPFTVGGGVRSPADGASLLRAGADKVSVNTAALARPTLISELANLLGSQAVVVAIDAAKGKARSHAGSEPTGRSAVDWAVEAEERGVGAALAAERPERAAAGGEVVLEAAQLEPPGAERSLLSAALVDA